MFKLCVTRATLDTALSATVGLNLKSEDVVLVDDCTLQEPSSIRSRTRVLYAQRPTHTTSQGGARITCVSCVGCGTLRHFLFHFALTSAWSMPECIDVTSTRGIVYQTSEVHFIQSNENWTLEWYPHAHVCRPLPLLLLLLSRPERGQLSSDGPYSRVPACGYANKPTTTAR
jgi:hypothetical protein